MFALSSETSGGNNTAVGYGTLELQNINSTGNNTALGYLAGQLLSTGTGNTLLGAFAGDAAMTCLLYTSDAADE